MSQFDQSASGDELKCEVCGTRYDPAGEPVDVPLPETRREREAREVREKLAKSNKKLGRR